MNEKIKLASTFIAKPSRNCKIVINLHQGDSSNYYYEINTYTFRDYYEDNEVIVRQICNHYLVVQTQYLTEHSMEFVAMVLNLNKENYINKTAIFYI